ncbi:MAG: type II secretion system protein GspJ [Myxococcota bacterium]
MVWPIAYNVRSFSLRYLDQATTEWKTEWDTRSADTPYRLPRAVEIGLVLIAPDPEDESGERTVDVPFLSRVVLEYAERIPNPNDPSNTLAAAPTRTVWRR